MIPFKSINFVGYDMYCDCLSHLPGKKEITNHDRLVAGGISGVAATVVCLPLDTVIIRIIMFLVYDYLKIRKLEIRKLGFGCRLGRD